VSDELLAPLLNHKVVLDMCSRYVCLGKLVRMDEHYLVLDDADVHDLRDSPTTRENYVVAARESGIKPNRKQVVIRKEEVVAIALFKHIIGTN
jgi:small nuclear ribonucleoprotein (snRNP)-like protein